MITRLITSASLAAKEGIVTVSIIQPTVQKGTPFLRLLLRCSSKKGFFRRVPLDFHQHRQCTTCLELPTETTPWSTDAMTAVVICAMPVAMACVKDQHLAALTPSKDHKGRRVGSWWQVGGFEGVRALKRVNN